MNGKQLPQLVTSIPGPAARALAQRLARVESRNITAVTPHPPIFWQSARGANVRDVDGNIYIDLTAGFGVANAGHSNEAVARAIGEQAATLAHALGDVYPADTKVKLLERLAEILPAPLRVSILGNSGAEAVEAALKTAVMHTRRTGILAFLHAYHGLTYGALGTTHRAHFRAPFEAQLFDGVQFVPFPDETADKKNTLAHIDDVVTRAESSATPIGCILVEPIQGRGGIVVPPSWFLPALRSRCDGVRTILICDEIYVGMGRTGRWLASEHCDVVPDIAVIGKGLSGALPISAAVGTPAVMESWPASTGEAIHTSTFLGNPIACAAALAQIDEITQGRLLQRAEQLGRHIAAHITSWRGRHGVKTTRGLGLIQGVVLEDAAHALRVVERCLQQGVLLLLEGTNADVLAITPPAVIAQEQLDFALAVIERALASE